MGHRLQNERVKVNKLYSFFTFVSDVLGFYIYIMIKGLLMNKRKGDLIVSEILLQTKALTKQYGHQKAVDNVDIHIKKGAIYGFIGRNGAGKTTCMRMIGGLAKPTSGEISMFGYTGKDLSKVRSRVGCLIEAPGVYPNMTAKENIEMKCRLFGISKKGYAEGILDKVGLLNVGKKKNKEFLTWYEAEAWNRHGAGWRA